MYTSSELYGPTVRTLLKLSWSSCGGEASSVQLAPPSRVTNRRYTLLSTAKPAYTIGSGFEKPMPVRPPNARAMRKNPVGDVGRPPASICHWLPARSDLKIPWLGNATYKAP